MRGRVADALTHVEKASKMMFHASNLAMEGHAQNREP